jgi:putative membrane protein
MRLPPNSSHRIEEAIRKAEAHTSVELVVIGRPFSGSYRDVDQLFGLLLALGCLTWALFSKTAVPPVSVIPGLLAFWIVGWMISRWSPALRRLLTSGARRERQADSEAQIAFLRSGVEDTRGRTGLLIHVSFLERRVTLVADRGIRAEFDREEIEEQRRRLEGALRGSDPVGGLCGQLLDLGRELGRRLPPGADNPDEISNVPLLETAP